MVSGLVPFRVRESAWLKNKLGLWGSSDLSVDGTLATIVEPIVRMLRKGWFDDAVGLVEGFEIFRHLMKHGIILRILSHSTCVLICRTQTS